MSMNERWKRRFPRAFCVQPDSIRKWTAKSGIRVLEIVRGITKKFDQFRRTPPPKQRDFEDQWLELQKIMVNQLRTINERNS